MTAMVLAGGAAVLVVLGAVAWALIQPSPPPPGTAEVIGLTPSPAYVAPCMAIHDHTEECSL